MSSEPGALLPVNKKEIGFGVIEYKVQIPAHQLCDLGYVKVYDAKFSLFNMKLLMGWGITQVTGCLPSYISNLVKGL